MVSTEPKPHLAAISSSVTDRVSLQMLLGQTNSLGDQPLARRQAGDLLEAALKGSQTHSGLRGEMLDRMDLIQPRP